MNVATEKTTVYYPCPSGAPEFSQFLVGFVLFDL